MRPHTNNHKWQCKTTETTTKIFSYTNNDGSENQHDQAQHLKRKCIHGAENKFAISNTIQVKKKKKPQAASMHYLIQRMKNKTEYTWHNDEGKTSHLNCSKELKCISLYSTDIKSYNH